MESIILSLLLLQFLQIVCFNCNSPCKLLLTISNKEHDYVAQNELMTHQHVL